MEEQTIPFFNIIFLSFTSCTQSRHASKVLLLSDTFLKNVQFTFFVRFMTGERVKKANNNNCGALTFTMRTTITHRTVAQVSQVIVDFHTHPIMQAGIWVTPISFCFKTKLFTVLELCYNKMIITRASR